MDFKSILGITIPKEFSQALGLKPAEYVEVYFRDKNTLIVKKHGVKPSKIVEGEL